MLHAVLATALIGSCSAFIPNAMKSPRNAFDANPTITPNNKNNNGNNLFGTALGMATWSDSKAVMDYQNFLSSGLQEPEKKKDGPSVIIRPAEGPSDLADSIEIMGMGDDCVIVPYQSLPGALGGENEYPIYICLPPWQIADFIRNLPEEYMDRTDDFVFFSGGLQCGNIEDTLKDFGYCRDSMTQVLASGFRLTPAKRVVDTTVALGLDAQGEQKYAGECTACGKWNSAIAARMERNNVRCRVDFYREWRRLMWERSVYDAVFNILGAVRTEPTTVADVANYYGEEVGDMVWEMSGLLRGWRALTLTFGFEERLYGAAEVNGDGLQCTLVDEMYPYIWGNQVFVQSKTFLEYLHYAQKDLGLLQSVQLPPITSDEDYSSVMRKGNLRADGAI